MSPNGYKYMSNHLVTQIIFELILIFLLKPYALSVSRIDERMNFFAQASTGLLTPLSVLYSSKYTLKAIIIYKVTRVSY